MAVAAFLLDRERHLRRIEAQLRARTWTPRPARLLFIREPKPRVITVAPFECRVVHHALCDLIEPALRRSMTADTFACLSGRGVHRALLRHQTLMKSHRWLLQLDVYKYFPTLPHPGLLAQLDRRIRCEGARWLIREILNADADLYQDPAIWRHLGAPDHVPEAGRGLPVGYLTSQVFGNHYLSPLDHFVKRTLKVPGYVRYMDNLTLFGKRLGELRRWGREVQGYVEEELGLKLREERSQIRACRGTAVYLGCEVSRQGVVPGSRARHRMVQKIVRAAQAPRKGAEHRLPAIVQGYGGLYKM